MHIFLLLSQIETFLKEFFTFLIIFSEAFSAKTQVISLPYPGVRSRLQTGKQATNLFSKSASELCANTPPLTTEAAYSSREGAKASKEPCSNGSTTEDFSHNSSRLNHYNVYLYIVQLRFSYE
jgi:hypothetical protein